MDEQFKMQKFVFKHDQERFLLAHGLINYIFSKTLQISLDNLRFNFNENGKPKIENNYEIKYNISHSEEMVVIAISIIKEIGVDVEKINENVEYKQIAKAFFHPIELNTFKNKSKIEQGKNFFKIWVTKEAYTKALGIGLNRPMNSFYMEENFHDKACIVDEIENIENYMYIFEPQVDYIAAVSILD